MNNTQFLTKDQLEKLPYNRLKGIINKTRSNIYSIENSYDSECEIEILQKPYREYFDLCKEVSKTHPNFKKE